MKKTKYLALLMLLSVFAFAQQEPTPKEFTVSGKVKNGAAGEKVYLQFSTNPARDAGLNYPGCRWYFHHQGH